MLSKTSLKNWHIALFVLSGTIIRFLYAKYSSMWMAAPDQLAWGLSLDEMLRSGHFSYHQMIHYPHEGGSFLLSLLALCLRPFEGFLPSLSLAALVFDTGIRFVQIKVADQVFGSKTALLFGLWTILAVPLLVPWSGVNFGLHYLSSVFPFILLYAATKRLGSGPSAAVCGLVAGLAVSFAYDNIILIPAYIVWVLLSPVADRKLLHLLKFVGFLILALLPHLACRLLLENGFNLENDHLFSIRGVEWKLSLSQYNFSDIFSLWHKGLPASFFLSSGGYLSPSVQRYLVMGFMLLGLLMAIFIRDKKSSGNTLSIWMVVVFAGVFALSPFFANDIDKTGYIYYRHLAYILPLIVLMMFSGFAKSGKPGMVIAGFWILLCGYFSIVYMKTTEPKTTTNYRACGWILARKYGDDPKHLIRLNDVASVEQREELTIGFGWGLTATILEGKTEEDTAAINQLMQLAEAFPNKERKLVFTGVEYAFSEGITPILDHEFLAKIKGQIMSEQ